ncbi:hypothetical protein DOY81_009832, partial [Sarcophaga bullata]
MHLNSNVTEMVQTCPEHSSCMEPNKCICNPGYAMMNQTCRPICENECPLNSWCAEPNKCNCLEGYEMISNGICQAKCDKPCPDHAMCAEPNKCQCEAGYQLRLSSIYNLFCEPICQTNCSTFGQCVAPNKCECLEGYEMDELDMCLPKCSKGCENGLCFQPEICICNAGYLMGPQNKCEPVCSEPCQNGSCIEPEMCQCHEGYKFKTNSINICEPHCEPSCINGICVAPNMCICQDQHEPIKTNSYMILSSFQPALLRETTTSSAAVLQEAQICNEQCLCWQEFDEFGPLVSQKCMRLCADKHDKPCLDLSQCQCDLRKTQLICRSIEDMSVPAEDDDPILYSCKIPRSQTTTLKPGDTIKSSDMKSSSIQTIQQAHAHVPWTLIAIVTFVILTSIVAVAIYVRCRKHEAPNQCACNEGFEDSGSGICLPICESSCNENASCIAPNQCACNEGFKDWQ